MKNRANPVVSSQEPFKKRSPNLPMEEEPSRYREGS